jgi:hypothetical protein
MLGLPRISAFALAFALTVKTACLRAQPAPARPVSEEVLERFEIPKGGTLLLLPVELKEKTYFFALDTGASTCVYDCALIPLLGEPMQTTDVESTDGVTRVHVFKSPDAKLGSLSLRTGFPVISTDLRRLRETAGEKVYGLIGMDVLAKHVVRIDPDQREVVFLRSIRPNPGRRVPITIENRVPYVRVRISGIEEPQLFLVDTGCFPGGGTGLMRVEAFDELAKKDKIKITGESQAESLLGTTVRRRGRVEEVSLADHRHAELIFNASARNVLGLTYWSRYVVTFDFPGNLMYLTQSSQFGRADMQDLSGLTLVRIEGRTLVVSVEKGSPAATGGIAPQDVILKANGQNAEDMPLQDLRLLLAGKAAQVSLLICRGGVDREVSLLLPGGRQP